MERTTDREWELSDFTGSTILNGVEILVDGKRNRALVVYPWYLEPKDVREAMLKVQSMGFTTITEMGNLTPYTIQGHDTDDCDYYLVETDD